jgi:hypothetical protein
MLQPRDIVIMLQISHAAEGWTVRSLGEPIGVAAGSMHRGLDRLARVGIYDPRSRALNAAVLDELVRHGLRFVVGGALGAESRGVPTAWGAPLLRAQLSIDAPPPVWPSAQGAVRGPALEPIVANAVELIDSAPEVAADLALIDAIRVGAARDRRLATDLLLGRLAGVAA